MMATTARKPAPKPVSEPQTATAKFNPAAYARLIRDRSRLIAWDEILDMLADETGKRVYGIPSFYSWKRRGVAENGYGPVGLPKPDEVIDRGQAAGRPLYYVGTIARWAMQTGRMHLITFLGQQPRRTGKNPASG